MRRATKYCLAVFGSRTLTGERVKKHIAEAIATHNATCIVTAGEPRGVCAEARDYARHHAMPLLLFFCDPKRAQGMQEWRSVAVYENCDHVLLVHDGESRGTQNEYELAIKKQIPYTYKLELLTEVDRQAEAITAGGDDIDIDPTALAELLGG